jgi:hypothetical protein
MVLIAGVGLGALVAKPARRLWPLNSEARR